MKLYFFMAYTICFCVTVFSFEQTGIASWYGPNFQGKLTANGEKFNTYSLTAAHKSLPLGSIVKVVSLDNGKEVVVRINDRGPFAKNRIIDLSKAAAVQLDFIKRGTARVKVYLIKEGDNKYYRYTSDTYTIQAGSFSNRNSAIDIVNKLKSNTINPVITEVKVNNKTLYRVEMKNLTYSMLHTHKLELHNANINNYLIKKHK